MYEKITIEGMLSKSPRKNKRIVPKNKRLGIIFSGVTLVGMLALECFTNNYVNLRSIPSDYSKQIERKADATCVFNDILANLVPRQDIGKKCISSPRLIIPDGVQDSLVKAIAGHANFGLADEGCASTSRLTIPNDIPDYLSESIAKHADFRLTEAEEKMVARWDSLLDYISTIDFFNKGHYGDPIFMKAIIAVESRGDPEACSEIYYARGLSQIRYMRAKSYIEWILKEDKLDFKKIAKDIETLGYDASFINKNTLERFRPSYLHNGPLNLILLCAGYQKNVMRFDTRLDLLSAEWNAGRTRGIISNQVANIDQTINYIGKVKALYNHWHNVSAEQDASNYMADKKVTLNSSKPYFSK